MTDRNVLHTRIDVSAGKMIRLEIKRAPIIRIPSTIVTAVSTAISVLYRLAFTPVACAKCFIECDRKYFIIKKKIQNENDSRQNNTQPNIFALIAKILPNI